MNMDEVKAILDSDPEKARLFEEALNSEELAHAGDIEALTRAAAAVGLEVSPEEAERFVASSLKLDEEELEHISGGAYLKEEDEACMVNYCCYAVLRHPDEVYEMAICWSNHVCFMSEHRYCGSTYINCWSNEN